jgi:hypothetical protein
MVIANLCLAPDRLRDDHKINLAYFGNRENL